MDNQDKTGQIVNEQDHKRDDICASVLVTVQKLTGALYRVTDLLSDKEPLKWTLRERAVSLMNNILSVTSSTATLKDSGVVFEEIKNSISHLQKTLELTSIGTYTASFNFEVLRKEYSKLQLILDDEKNVLISQPLLLIEEAEVEMKKITDTSDVYRTEKKDKGQEQIKLQKEKPKTVAQISQGSRPEKIINFLKLNNNKTVREISVIFEGISEKTVQRDLLSLVEQGKVMAKGEKRWRVYSLMDR